MRPMKRVKYDRGSAESAVGAARKLVAGTGEVRYVNPTCYGFTIDTRPAPFDVRCFRVSGDRVDVIGTR